MLSCIDHFLSVGSTPADRQAGASLPQPILIRDVDCMLLGARASTVV
jgi:hypothetical protein